MTWDELKQYQLDVYSTTWCGDCRRLKRILADRGVAYNEIDIDADPAAADRLVANTGKRAIPYVQINGAGFVRGYHKEAPGRWQDDLFLAEVAALLDK